MSRKTSLKGKKSTKIRQENAVFSVKCGTISVKFGKILDHVLAEGHFGFYWRDLSLKIRKWDERNEFKAQKKDKKRQKNADLSVKCSKISVKICKFWAILCSFLSERAVWFL
jgi:hypothetical protein